MGEGDGDPAPGVEGGPRPSGGLPTGWIVLFAVFFVVLVASIVRFLAADHLPARFLDAERTELVALDERRSLLRLLVQHVPESGQLRYAVEGRAPDDLRVVVDWTAQTRQTGRPERGGDRLLEILLPRVERVLVIDRRWARDEAMAVEASPGAGG